jgi:hypothetical protein
MDQDLAGKNSNFLINKLVDQTVGLSLDDPEFTLQLVTTNLPSKILTDSVRRQLWGRFYTVAAFQAYQLGQLARCRACVLRAVAKSPSNLRNRGLISIFVRSLVGNRRIAESNNLSSAQ